MPRLTSPPSSRQRLLLHCASKESSRRIGDSYLNKFERSAGFASSFAVCNHRGYSLACHYRVCQLLCANRTYFTGKQQVLREAVFYFDNGCGGLTANWRAKFTHRILWEVKAVEILDRSF